MMTLVLFYKLEYLIVKQKLDIFNLTMVLLFFYFAPKDFKIIWVSNILTLRVPGEDYSRNVS